MFYKSTNASHSQYSFESMDDCLYTLDIIRADNVARVFFSTTDNGFALVVGKFDLGLSDDDILSVLKSLDVDTLADLYEELSEKFSEIIMENYLTENEDDEEIYKESKPGGFVS